jgi:hypothetical protein
MYIWTRVQKYVFNQRRQKSQFVKALSVDYPVRPGSSSFLAKCDFKFINFMENL